MKIYLLLCAVILNSFPLAALAVSDDEQWDKIERERIEAVQEVRAKCRKMLRARVQEITSQVGGSTRVTFVADGRFVREKRVERVEKFSGEYILTWTELERPMPWTKGQQVRLGVGGNEVLVVDLGEVKIMYCRKRKDGEVEVLAQDDQRWLLLHPHRLGDVRTGMLGLDWVRGIGIVLTAEEAGDAGDELEQLGRPRVGFVPVNAPGRSVTPGRNGWQDGDSFFGKEEEPAEGYKGRLRNRIPPAQRIHSAG